MIKTPPAATHVGERRVRALAESVGLRLYRGCNVYYPYVLWDPADPDQKPIDLGLTKRDQFGPPGWGATLDEVETYLGNLP
jgi:hypothetical protein